jgi:hypothetical protein
VKPSEGDWPYLWLDATYVKGRQAGRVVPAAVKAPAAHARRRSVSRRAVLGVHHGVVPMLTVSVPPVLQ